MPAPLMRTMPPHTTSANANTAEPNALARSARTPVLGAAGETPMAGHSGSTWTTPSTPQAGGRQRSSLLARHLLHHRGQAVSFVLHDCHEAAHLIAVVHHVRHDVAMQRPHTRVVGDEVDVDRATRIDGNRVHRARFRQRRTVLRDPA